MGSILQETENLKIAWNLWTNNQLAMYMRRSIFHPQHYFTQNAIFDFLNEKNPGCAFLLEERFLSPLIKMYFYKNTWLRQQKRIFEKALERLMISVASLRKYRLKSAAIKKISVLDIGCGSGNYYINFKKTGA